MTLAWPSSASLAPLTRWLRRSDLSSGDRETPAPFVTGPVLAVAADEVPPQRNRWRRQLLIAALALSVLGIGLQQGVKRLPWMGPLIADSLRAALGVQAVIALEEASATVEDKFKQLAASVSAPRDTTQAVAITGALQTPKAPDSTQEPALVRGFVPRAVLPMFANVATAADGKWIAIKAESELENESPRMHLALLHPDRQRQYAELFVVAVDLSRTRLHAAPGTLEPQSLTAQSKDHVRSGLIPNGDRGRLVGLFNGGFKTVHGQYGMQVEGVTLVTPRGYACTVAARSDGSLRIGTWDDGGFAQGAWQWWRQTPPCLYEHGQMHRGLRWDDTRAWGAALKGNTVIRRSAIGTSKDGRVLYVGLGNAMTAKSLAAGMRHVGAWDIAQLDINWSYPKFVLFQKNLRGDLEASSLLKGFLVEPDDYLRKPISRDFFYLTKAD